MLATRLSAYSNNISQQFSTFYIERKIAHLTAKVNFASNSHAPHIAELHLYNNKSQNISTKITSYRAGVPFFYLFFQYNFFPEFRFTVSRSSNSFYERERYPCWRQTSTGTSYLIDLVWMLRDQVRARLTQRLWTPIQGPRSAPLVHAVAFHRDVGDKSTCREKGARV